MAFADVLVAAGVPKGAVKWMTCLLLSPLLCWGQDQVDNPVQRHAVAVLLGIGGCYYCFGSAILNLLITSGGVYLIMLLARRRSGILSMVFSMTFLIYCHVKAASGGAWKEGNIDFTGTQMVITARLTSIAFDYQDGIFDNKDLTAHAAENKLLTLPNPLEFLSYVFYLGSVLSGPWIPASQYFAYQQRTGVWARGEARPSGVLPCLKAIGVAIVALGVHSVLLPLVPDTAFLEDWFLRKNLGYKIGYIYVLGVACRAKYYFVWKWAEAACDAGGLGLSGWGQGKDGSKAALWARANNVNIVGVELAGSAADYPRTWNRCTGNWLRFYVYERLAPPERRALVSPFVALLVTQLLSGVWHGLFAGYFLFFATSIFMLQASKEMHRVQRQLPAGLLTILGKAFHTFISAFHLAYAAAVFVALFWQPSISLWKSTYFCGHISMMILIFTMPMLRGMLPKPKKDAGGEGEKKD